MPGKKTVKIQIVIMMITTVALFMIAVFIRPAFPSAVRPMQAIPAEYYDSFLQRKMNCQSLVEQKKGYLSDQDIIDCSEKAGVESMKEQ